MTSLFTNIYRGKLIESKHQAICLAKNTSNKIILSTNNENDIVYPRSAVKIFQALPFIKSNAHILFNLNKESIAMSCSSHSGELKHLKILSDWLKKININIKQLQCGIHNPLDEKSSNNLLLSGNNPSQLHNNCAGKHLGMISGCIASNLNIDGYTNINHPYQKLIRNTLEIFMESKIHEKYIGIDGCNAPQYAFSLNNLTTSMINLIKEKDRNNEYSKSINTIIQSINKFPMFIGGNNRFDSDVIKITNGRIFCKRGAEGVLLFANFYEKIGGVIKIIDGNNRAIPSAAMQIFLNLKMLTDRESQKLSNWSTQPLLNHTNKIVGKIVAQLNLKN